jgi:hypothetical protein
VRCSSLPCCRSWSAWCLLSWPWRRRSRCCLRFLFLAVYVLRFLAIAGAFSTRGAEAAGAALATCVLPAHFAVMVVPRGTPRAKLRALTVVVDLTPVQLVVAYEAEDLPEREQLRLAAVRFSQAPADLACLPARLNTTNYNEGGLGGSSQMNTRTCSISFYRCWSDVVCRCPWGGELQPVQ